MKIAVIGCRAMGSIYAARLAAAGHDVVAIDRHRADVERINRDGLRVTGPNPWIWRCWQPKRQTWKLLLDKHFRCWANRGRC